MSPTTASVTVDDDGRTLRVGGELDASSAPVLSRSLDDHSKDLSETLTLNMAGVTFIDSSALQVLVEYRRRFDEGGGALVIASPSAAVSRLLGLAGLDGHFDVTG